MESWKKKLKLIVRSSPFPYLLLLAVCLVTGLFASDALSVNADAVIYPYLFQDPSPNQLIFSEQHSNLLKFPLFVLQSILPYNYFSFTLVNLALLSATMLGILALSVKIIGKRFALHMAIALSAALIFSPLLVNNLIYTTVRNIEYPIILWVLYETAKYLTALRRKPPLSFIFAIITLTILLAGDFFFAYVSIAPVLMMLTVLFIVKYSTLKRKFFNFAMAAASLVASVVLSKLLQKALDVVGLYDTNSNYLNASSPVSSLGEISYALGIAGQQLSSLFGISLSNPGGLAIGIIVGFAAISMACGLLTYILRQLRKPLAKNTLALLLILTTGAGIFAVYVVSGLSFYTTTDGQLVPIDGARYLTLIPILTAILVPYALPLVTKDTHTRKTLAIILLVLALIGSVYTTKERYDQYQSTSAKQEAFSNLADTLGDNQVEVILGGYWTAPMLEFWSNQEFEYAIVAECNLPSIDNARRDWFTPDLGVENKSALVISMSGGDLPFLGYCPEDKLLDTYGNPSETSSFSRQNTGLSQVNLWYYDYDLRSKLRPVPLP